ncbi:CoA pyrophosphatase [Methylobacterium sp. BTF04]|uniref:CoA pyrophosphatase n=1 Tax=Methylobacterium sp. BTF04 TaxID=2708300 RepID=UPI0013CF967B|nr:CoA pyrophosphatase [Methylobacterium sp. BTF04]NEU12405.1 CoA pyrophosphatase [Methylobacterium sp. BTF04]
MSRDDALDDLIARASAHLSADPPEPGDPTSNPRGDHDLDSDDAFVPPGPHRQAAVLVPVVPRDDGLGVLFTLRAAHLRDHSGQIAFPGGKIDPADATPADAALREAHEEVGLDAAAIRLLGYLDPYLSATGFLVMPVLGLVDPAAPLRLNPDEVADTFEAPLAYLLDRSRRRIESGTWRGRTRRYYAISYGPHRIWGVTAGIVNNLHERLFP